MGLLAYGLIALAVLGAVGGFVAYERKAGGDSVRAELQPKLTACEGLRDALGGQIKEQNAAVEALAAQGVAKQQEAAKALRKAEGRAKTWDAQAKRLTAALAARKPTEDQSCTAAWTEIRKP